MVRIFGFVGLPVADITTQLYCWSVNQSETIHKQMDMAVFQ